MRRVVHRPLDAFLHMNEALPILCSGGTNTSLCLLYKNERLITSAASGLVPLYASLRGWSINYIQLRVAICLSNLCIGCTIYVPTNIGGG
jgi:hypothetical protein